MDGSTGAAGQISRAMMSLAPGTYSLSFDLIGSQRGLTTSTTVTLGSLFNQTFILGSSDVTDGIVNDTVTAAAPTTTALFSPAIRRAISGRFWTTSISRQRLWQLLRACHFVSVGPGLAGLMARRRHATSK
jgi:hypothetical protein